MTMNKKELINLINTIEEEFHKFENEINREHFADSETYWKVKKAWTLHDIRFNHFEHSKCLNKFRKETLESYLNAVRTRIIDLKGFMNNL